MEMRREGFSVVTRVLFTGEMLMKEHRRMNDASEAMATMYKGAQQEFGVQRRRVDDLIGGYSRFTLA